MSTRLGDPDGRAEWKKTTKYLGVTNNEKAGWDEHAEEAINKARIVMDESTNR